MAHELKNVITQTVECPVCLNTFRDPKILSCSHTFCKTCLDNLLECFGNNQTLWCPVCRVGTQLPNKDVSKLQTNLAMRCLIEDVEKQVCTNCKSEDKDIALFFCQDCGKYLCNHCQTTHSKWEDFRGHNVLAVCDIAAGNVSAQKYRKCRKHPKEGEEFFCSGCKRFACLRCVVMEHNDKGHRIIEASVYESNHMKSMEDLKSKAEKKRSCFLKIIDFIDEQKDRVSNAKKHCTDDINNAYEESVRQLTQRKTCLIGEVKRRTEIAQKELDRVKKSAQQQISHLTVITDLVTNRIKVPMDMDALAAHDTLCRELQEALGQQYPDYKRLRQSSKKGKCVTFERNVVRDKLGLGKIVNSMGKNIALPTKDSMNVMAPTPDGRMAVGCCTGGVHIFSADGQLQKTVLKDVNILKLGFLSEGRYVVRDTNNKITLYTPECEKLDERFETLNDEEGGFGDIAVDSDDLIYVAYMTAKEIQVFSPAGGKPIRQIPGHSFEPFQMRVHNDLLITTYRKTINVRRINREGNFEYELTKSNGLLYATVSQENTLLIACVKYKEGLVSIDEYTSELKHVKALISDYKIEKPETHWYYLQQYRSGEIAFCTPDRLYIFL